MNSSDVDEELPEPEFTHHADSAGVSNSRIDSINKTNKQANQKKSYLGHTYCIQCNSKHRYRYGYLARSTRQKSTLIITQGFCVL